MKPKPKRAPRKKRVKVVYTHKDSSGMLWHFVGNRPRSALADAVMIQCGFDPNK